MSEEPSADDPLGLRCWNQEEKDSGHKSADFDRTTADDSVDGNGMDAFERYHYAKYGYY